MAVIPLDPPKPRVKKPVPPVVPTPNIGLSEQGREAHEREILANRGNVITATPPSPPIPPVTVPEVTPTKTEPTEFIESPEAKQRRLELNRAFEDVPVRNFAGEPSTEVDFSNITPGGHKTLPPVAGIIPSDTDFKAFSETLNLPFTLVGGTFVDGFNNVKSGGLFVKPENPLNLLTKNPLETSIDTIKRQQARGAVTRGVSEGLIDLGLPGLLASGTRLGIRGLTMQKAFAKEILSEADRVAIREGLSSFSTHQERLRTLEEFGLDLGDAMSNEIVAPLLPLPVNEVVTNTGITGQVVGRLGGNPSVLRDTPAGRILTAYERQRINGENLTDIVVGAVIDSRRQRGTGRLDHILPINKDGFFGDTGKLWQDVFSQPDKYSLSQETRALIDDYNQVIEEVRNILDDVGIDQATRRDPSSVYYIPRDVLEIRGIENLRGTDRDLARHFDEATEGFAQGIRYSTSPRDTLALYVRWAYRKAAKKQFDDAIEPHSLTAKQIVDPGITEIYKNSMLLRRGVEVNRRRVAKAIHTADANLRSSAIRVGERAATLTQARQDLAFIDTTIQQLDVLPRELETIRPARIRQTRSPLAIQKDLDSIQEMIQEVQKTPGKNPTDVQRELDAIDTLVKDLENEKLLSPTIQSRVGIIPETTRRERIRRISRAKQAKDEYNRLLKTESGAARRIQTAERIQEKIRTRRALLGKHLESLDVDLKTVRNAHTTARSNYRQALTAAEKRNQVPGRLFGPNQPDEIQIGEWRNRFMPIKDVEMLKTALDTAGTPGLSPTRVVEITGNMVRFLGATGDFAMPLIQGLPVLAENPAVWGKMLLRHHQAFFDPTVGSRLMKENITDYHWLAQHGVPVGDIEFFSALKPGEGISADFLFKSLPNGEEVRRLLRLGGEQTFGRFQASYNTGLGYSRVLLLKATRDSWKGSDAELAQHLRNLTGGLDTRALGVSRGQRAAEGIWMAFSPKLLRSTIALVSELRNVRSVNGARLAQNLRNLVLGATTFFTVTGLALGKSWEEIGTSLNPLAGKKFLAHEINGDWVGLGGQVRAILQLLAGVTIGGVQDPSSLSSLDRFENPLLRFIGGRGAPGLDIVSGAVEAATGGRLDALPFDEVDGPIDFAKHMGKKTMFFAVQGALEGEKPLTVAFATQGARTSPQTVFEKRDAAREQVMQEEGITGDFDDLDPLIRDEINRHPSVLKTTTEVKKTLRERKSEVQTYSDDRQRARDIGINLVRGSALQLGPSRAFREILPEHNKEIATRMNEVDTNPQHAEAQAFFDELDPSENKVSIAEKDYFDTLEAAQLYNQFTGKYNFRKRDEIVRGLEEKYGASVIADVRKRVESNDHPLVKELRADRETLRRYWELDKLVLKDLGADLATHKLWAEYQENGDGELLRANPILRSISRLYTRRKEVMFRSDPEIQKLLIKWEYRQGRR